MTDMSEARALASLLLSDPKTSEPPRLLQGVVASVDRVAPTNRLTLTVYISGGSSFPVGNIKYLDSYTPRVNDTVWLMKNGPDLIVIGKLDRSIGNPSVAKRFRGTAAERAGTLPNLWGVSSGDEWYETDTKLRYTWDGSAWVMSGWPKQYARVSRAADFNLATGWSYAPHDTTTYNVGGLNVGWHIVATITGYWHIRSKYCIVVANNPQVLILASEIGGSLFYRGDQIQLRGQASGDIVTMHYDETHYVEAGQAMYMQIHNGSTNTCVMYGGANMNHFAAEFVGA